VRAAAAILLAAAAALSLLGCRGSEGDTPERTVEGFLSALEDGDGERTCGELTAAGRGELERFLPLFVPGTKPGTCSEVVERAAKGIARGTLRRAKVRTARVKGATATLTTEGGPNVVRLIRSDGEWRIVEQFHGGWRAFGIPRYPPGVNPPPPAR
jgi:hypothetical protein